MGKTRFIRILAVVFLSVFLCSYAEPAPPQVIATDPPNGVVGVRPDFDTIRILFDKPIMWPDIFPGTTCMTVSSNWPRMAMGSGHGNSVLF